MQLEFLSLKETVPVVGFLSRALTRPDLLPQARKALARFERSKKHPDAAARAREVLEQFEAEGQQRAAKIATPAVPLDVREVEAPSGENQTFHNTIDTTSLEPHFRILVKALAEGRVIPFSAPASIFIVDTKAQTWTVKHFHQAMSYPDYSRRGLTTPIPTKKLILAA